MSKLDLYIGLDVGSVSINLILLDEKYHVLEKIYLRTQGKPVAILSQGLEMLRNSIPAMQYSRSRATGSGRELAAAMVGADVVKNEITAHGMAVLQYIPDAQTILEIGGQDSKIILLRNGWYRILP